MSNSGIFNSPDGEEEAHAYHSPLEEKVRTVLSPFQQYINHQITASLFLLICTVAAIVWATMPNTAESYRAFTHIAVGFHVSQFKVDMPLEFWVNDVLLSLFFFFVGLEIKREFLVGELTDSKRATLVIFAAIGGMCVPAFIYYLINAGTPTAFGWGIPMATDTAYAIGILSCFRNRIPPGVSAFLAAAAVIDDIGTILVIALFYSEQLNMLLLFVALSLCFVMAFLNYAGCRRPLPYLIIGLCIWLSIQTAGIHGTVSGILIAFLIPARPQQGPNQFIRRTKRLLSYFESRKEEAPLVLEDQAQHELLEEVQQAAKEATTPLQRWESHLELPVSLLVLPLFALVNAGIPIDMSLFDDLFTNVMSLGILLGLVLGKPLGVLLFSYIALRSRIGSLPDKTHFNHLASAACLTGIGFTMSIFISDLSFGSEPALLILAKGAVLIASLTMGCVGAVALYLTRPTSCQA